MEGERIFSELKAGKNLDGIVKRVEEYLKPVSPDMSTKNIKKYKLFALKTLWQSIVLLQPETDTTRQNLLLTITQHCSSALLISEDIQVQLSAHTFSSLLLHQAQVCWTIGRVEACIESCELFLNHTHEECEQDKQVFTLMWRCASQIDKKAKSRKEGLYVRQKALKGLLKSGAELVKVLEFVTKAEQLFTQSIAAPTLPDQVVLHPFHSALLPHSYILRTIPSLPFSVPLAQYLLHRIVLAMGVGQEAEGEELVERGVLYVQEHAGDQPIAAQALALQLWVSIRMSKPEALCTAQLQDLSAVMEECTDKDHFSNAPSSLPKLVDAMDLVVSYLRPAKQSVTSWQLSPECFPSLEATISGTVACMRSFLSTQPQSPSLSVRVFTKQLTFLNTLSHVLADMLVSLDDEIECYRDCPQQRRPSHSSQSPDDSLKSILVKSCLPILHQSRDIIAKGADVLSTDEHLWLGNSAYKLANSLVQEGLYIEALPVIEFSCQELLTMCNSSLQGVSQSSKEQAILLLPQVISLLWITSVSTDEETSLCSHGNQTEGKVETREEMMECVQEICEQEQRMLNGDFQGLLSETVRAWLCLAFSFSGKLTGVPAQRSMLAAVACVTQSQVSSALKVLSVILDKCDTGLPRAQALALYTDLGGPAPSSILEEEVVAPMEEGVDKVEIVAALKSCLAQASMLFSQGKMEKCKAALLCVLDHPLFLSTDSTETRLLLAKAQLLTAHCLLWRTFDLQPNFLRNSRAVHKFLNLSPAELVGSAVKLLWTLASHKRIWEPGNKSAKGGISSNILHWEILFALLKAFHMGAKLFALLGLMDKAYMFASEGARLAKRVHMQDWYCDFLLELHQILSTQGKSEPSAKLASRLSELLGCCIISHHEGPSQPVVYKQRDRPLYHTLSFHCQCLVSCQPKPHPSMFLGAMQKALEVLEKGANSVTTEEVMILKGKVACALAECYLAARQPKSAEKVLQWALQKLGSENRGYEFSVVTARLHHLMGVALAQELERGCEEGVWFERSSDSLHADCVQEFLMSYQLCFPATPTVLLRDTCLWLALLLNQPNHAHHFLSQSQHLTFTKRAHHDMEKRTRSTKKSVYSAEELQECFKLQSPRWNGPLSPPSHPPSPGTTSATLSLLPHDWTILTLALAPKTHLSNPSYLLVAKAAPTKPPAGKRKGRRPQEPVVHKVCGSSIEKILEDVAAILVEGEECSTITNKREWWSKRKKLDQRMKTCLGALDLPVQASGSVLLVLGCRVHQLPWELCFPDTAIITRTPSLTFAAAHKAMVDQQQMNIHATYYVVNPEGDLEKTEEIFGEWFSRLSGWEGVVGKHPDLPQLAAALEEKDVYIYCGHGAGPQLQGPRCRAAALLMGCSSAKMVDKGECDPVGIPLSYLAAGCPIQVGCLWGVTDGDLDRFSQSLLQTLLSDSDPALPTVIQAARSACKLKHLCGASPVAYGLPMKSTF